MVLMKRILYIVAAIVLVLATGCRKEEKKIDYKGRLTGEWHCTPAEIDADIYVSFDAEGSFDLYQQIGEGRHRHYSGVWAIEENTLSGTYSDGSAWGSSYTVEFKSDKEMSLTALNGSEEVMSYFREDIPAEIKEGSIEVKAVEADYCGPVL